MTQLGRILAQCICVAAEICGNLVLQDRLVVGFRMAVHQFPMLGSKAKQYSLLVSFQETSEQITWNQSEILLKLPESSILDSDNVWSINQPKTEMCPKYLCLAP